MSEEVEGETEKQPEEVGVKKQPSLSKEELKAMLTERISKAEVTLYIILMLLLQEAIVAAKEKLEEHKNARIAAEEQLAEKLGELKAIADEADGKIKAQVKEKTEVSAKRIEEATAKCAEELNQKKALLQERDFMVMYNDFG